MFNCVIPNLDYYVDSQLVYDISCDVFSSFGIDFNTFDFDEYDFIFNYGIDLYLEYFFNK